MSRILPSVDGQQANRAARERALNGRGGFPTERGDEGAQWRTIFLTVSLASPHPTLRSAVTFPPPQHGPPSCPIP